MTFESFWLFVGLEWLITLIMEFCMFTVHSKTESKVILGLSKSAFCLFHFFFLMTLRVHAVVTVIWKKFLWTPK